MDDNTREPSDYAAMFENMEGMLMNLANPHARRISFDLRAVRAPLESLCERINSHEGNLRKLLHAMRHTFHDEQDVLESLRHTDISIDFLPMLHHQVSNILSRCVQGYLCVSEQYKFYVQGRLDAHSGIRRNNDETKIAEEQAHEIFKLSLDLYIAIKGDLPKLVQGVKKSLASYDQYLQSRFVKTNDEKMSKKMEMMLRYLPEEMKPRLGNYEKVKFVDQNPLLTDILLEVTKMLPDYKEKIIEGRRKHRTERIVSNFAVQEGAEKVAAISDPYLLSYIRTPATFFANLGGLVEQFYSIFKAFETPSRLCLELPLSQQMLRQEVRHNAALLQALDQDMGRIERDIRSITQMDLDRIVQDPDEVLPTNRRERDLFALREKLFTYLIDQFGALADITDFDERERAAQQVVRKAIDLKSEMTQLNLSYAKRKLRQNRVEDNEYYEGRTGEVGAFDFERMPAPQVEMNDVIGESFTVAKKHLNEIIETAEYARIMQMTAPGGKVKSNILLVGPYGCGKTELARAVCGDKRVIGASVSVANVLTAYMHESVNNVKRIYDKAKELHGEAREVKPFVLTLDEFDGWFARGNGGTYTDTDMKQIENVFLEVLDGMGDYNGIITVAMTNKLNQVPHGILRRFRYVDVVGQLTHLEREQLLKMFLEKRLPVAADVSAHYAAWAKLLDHAPGDVVRKVIDEVHFDLIPTFLREHQEIGRRVEKVLLHRETKDGRLGEKDILYVRTQLERAGVMVQPKYVERALTKLLNEPQIKAQIATAKKVYEDAHKILDDVAQYRPLVI